MEIFRLCDIPIGTTVKVFKLLSTSLSKQRLLDLGIIPNTSIYVLRKSLWGDPTAYIIRDTCIALREEESKNILVTY